MEPTTQCKICTRIFNKYLPAWHLQDAHNMKISEYTKLYGKIIRPVQLDGKGNWVSCKECKKEIFRPLWQQKNNIKGFLCSECKQGITKEVSCEGCKKAFYVTKGIYASYTKKGTPFYCNPECGGEARAIKSKAWHQAHKEDIGTHTKETWTNPETRAKRIKGIQEAVTPEALAKRLEGNKKYWSKAENRKVEVKRRKLLWQDPKHRVKVEHSVMCQLCSRTFKSVLLFIEHLVEHRIGPGKYEKTFGPLSEKTKGQQLNCTVCGKEFFLPAWYIATSRTGEFCCSKECKQQHLLRARKPTYLEEVVSNFIIANNLPFKYVGDGGTAIQDQKLMKRRCFPDFISTEGKKLLIETDGCYYHICEKHFGYLKAAGGVTKTEIRRRDREKRYLYKKLGYNVLTLWEHEVLRGNEWKQKLISFSRT